MPPKRVGTVEHGTVARDSSSRGREVREHQKASRSRGVPAEPFGGDPRRKPQLRIVYAQRLLDRGELRFDFDDEQRARRSVPGKDVDRASLSIHRKGNLRASLPAERLQDLRGSTDQGGMGLVHQPVELTSAPSNDEEHLCVEGLCDLTEAPDRHCRYAAAFQARDHVLACPGLVREVLLSPPAAMTECSDPAAGAQVVHRGSLVEAAQPALIGRRKPRSWRPPCGGPCRAQRAGPRPTTDPRPCARSRSGRAPRAHRTAARPPC